LLFACAVNDYDFLILGAGWGGLCAASLLAKAGHRVAVVEARDRAGGCGQSFTLQGFTFCAEMQYLMECGEGGLVQNWLRELDLHRAVQFNPFDPDGYDRIELPGFSFRIPNDAKRLEAALIAAFPADEKGLTELFAVLQRIETEREGAVFEASRFLSHPFQFKDTVLYGPWPVGRIFDHFALSPRVRAVLAGQCGDVGLPPSDEPLLALQSVLFGYCKSAHFPSKGMGHFVESVVGSITGNGGAIFYDAPVTRIVVAEGRVTGVDTPRGEFRARTVISNIDPAVTHSLIEGASVPQYQQSQSCFTVFLGLDLDLTTRGFGRSNIWHFPSEDVSAAIAHANTTHSYEDPFFFFSTPSLNTDPSVLAPAGCTTVQLNVSCDFDFFERAVQLGTHAFEKARVEGELLRAVERRLVPGLASHIVVKESWTPVDLAQRVGLVRGGMYGARLDLQNRVLHAVGQDTAWPNLFLTGATAGGPGLQGVVASSTRLVKRLLAA
jgi:phytoene dehydrogenase-like protein